MIIFLIIGVLVGVVSVLFILQNVSPVTVTFFAYHLNGSLALILFLTLFAGIILTMLILLPGTITNEFRISRLKRLNRDLEDELADMRRRIVAVPTDATVVVTDSSDVL